MGLDFITIMDSAGTMSPDEVKAYVSRMVRRVSIPVGFHGHDNLGLSVADAVAAYREGAEIIDCGLMGMARSAGNLATEMAVAVFERLGIRTADNVWASRLHRRRACSGHEGARLRPRRISAGI